MGNLYDENVSRFAVAFMRAVIAWNNAERAAERILISFGGRSLGLRIAAAHLQARSMKETLLTLCDSLSDESAPAATDLASHVAHFVEGMDTLRAYRNFYVHSLVSVGPKSKDDPSWQGYLYATEAKGRMAFVNQQVSTEQLEVFMRHTLELKRYGDNIAEAMFEPPNVLGQLGKVHGGLVASLQKPTWPDKLKKHREYL